MQPYVGEIRMFAGLFAPLQWLFCDGSLLSIGQYELLYNVIGTTYGGDGVQTFALPDLRCRVPMHQGSGNVIGQVGGSETVTLTIATFPSHSHPLMATSTGQTASPKNALPAVAVSTHPGQMNTYGPQASQPTNLNPATIQPNTAGGQPHNNLQPYLVINYIIAVVGVFPPPS